MDPPLVLICLAKSARCHPAFMALDRWNINILGEEPTELAYRFASRDADKLGTGEFNFHSGLPPLPDVPVRMEWRPNATHEGGHTRLLTGELVTVERSRAHPARNQKP